MCRGGARIRSAYVRIADRWARTGSLGAVDAGWRFVGREDQLDLLSTLMAAGTSALLVGEPGIGKTALAARLRERLVGAARPIGAVTGQALPGRIPFEAFAALLSADAVTNSERTPSGVAREVAATLGSGPGGRGVLFVDDVQSLDPDSVLVLHHLVVDGLATLVMTSLTPAQLPIVLHRLVRGGSCRLIEIFGLDDDDLASALEGALGAPVDPRTERVFLRRASGNPLLMRELLAAAQDAQSLAVVDGVWRLVAQPPLARTVRDLVSTRIAVLPQDQLVALETVAATEPLPIGVAVELVGWASLEALESAGLVTLRDEPGRSQVTTAHPIFGDAIRADLPQLRLRRLRLAGARALESMPGPAPHDLVRAAMWRLDSGERGDPEWLLGAARAARSISLETSERLATAAVAAGAPVSATVLLAEILTHAGRPNEAATLLAALPPETLPAELRDALVYLDALHHGLLSGDLDLAADLVAGALSGEANASDRLQATYSSFLAFDARFEEALTAGSRVAQDPGADPESRTIAAMGVVGAHYWLGHGRRATELADVLMPIADRARDALPYGAPAIELIAICAMIDNGDLEAAMKRAKLMAERAVDRGDPFAAPRAEYCIARVHLLRGRTRSAARLFRRCVSALTPFDLTFTRHLHAMVARSEALTGDAVAGRRALVVGDAPPDMPPYEPDWALAEAALSAAELDLTKAADQAAYVAGIAAGRAQWTAALHASHDAARYGASNSILAEMRRAARHTDSTLAPLFVSHAEALARGDGLALDNVSRGFAAKGLIALAVEAATSAAATHAQRGDRRSSHASSLTVDRLRVGCEELAFPWLVGFVGAVPLTRREREVATLASADWADAAIAAHLGISVRTVETHLAHVYDKLGIHGRRDLHETIVGQRRSTTANPRSGGEGP